MPVAASFCFLCDGTKFAYVAFTVTAPGISARLKVSAALAAIQGAVEIAKRAGCKIVWTSTENLTIARLSERAGFVRTTPHINLFMPIDPTIEPDMLAGDEFFQKG